MTDKEIIKEAIKVLLKENYSWHNYNPRGEYVNICFTLKGTDMYQFVLAELKKAKVVKLEM